MTSDQKRAAVLAARAAVERMELARDDAWLAWMRTKPGEERHDELIGVLHSPHARIARKQREIAALEGKASESWLRAVA